MLTAGATFLDLGGYSSRPGATDISQEEELARVIEPIEVLCKSFPEAIISIDTFRSKVAEEAIQVGASMINDISGGHLDQSMLDLVAQLQVPYIAMHMKGTPQNMRDKAVYEDVVLEMTYYFSEILEKCKAKGIHDVILDPGFGFAKTSEQGFEVFRQLEYFQRLERPLLIGVSRKSMIFRTLGITAQEALNGTTVLNTLAISKGASILRVHDVKEAVEAVKLVTELI